MAKVRRWHVLNVLAFLLLLYIVVPRLGYFKNSLSVVTSADFRLVLLAAGLMAATYVMAAGMYQLLAKKSLNFWRTLWVRVASGFVNRLLPDGIGGISLSVEYLRACRHNLVEASTVVGTNNFIGFAGHMVLAAVLIVFTNVGLSQLHLPQVSSAGYVGLAAVFVILGVVLTSVKRLRNLAVSTVRDIFQNLLSYRRKPERLLLAVLLSMVLTATYASILFFCAQAVAVQITFSGAFIVFTLGMFTATVTPTPGGLVGMEAGLIAGFVAAGVSGADALAATLLFRLLTYWLPMLPGIAAFEVSERRRYF